MAPKLILKLVTPVADLMPVSPSHGNRAVPTHVAIGLCWGSNPWKAVKGTEKLSPLRYICEHVVSMEMIPSNEPGPRFSKLNKQSTFTNWLSDAV